MASSKVSLLNHKKNITSSQWQDVILRRRRSNIQVVTQLVTRTLSSSSWDKQETDSGDGKPLNSGMAQNEIKPGRNPNNLGSN